MQRYNNSVVLKFDSESSGNAAANIPVTVRVAETGFKATIYSDNGVTETDNPVITDDLGNYGFYGADGIYNIVINDGKESQVTIPNVQLFDSEALETEPFIINDFTGSIINLPSAAVFISLHLNGRLINPAEYTISGDGLTVTLSDNIDEPSEIIIAIETKDSIGVPSNDIDFLSKTFTAVFSTKSAMIANALGITFTVGMDLKTKRTDAVSKSGTITYEVFNTVDVVPWLNKTALLATTENPLYAVTLDNGLIAVAREIPKMNYIEGLEANPQDYGVIYGTGMSSPDRVNNTLYLQACIDDAKTIVVTGPIETEGQVKLRNGRFLRGSTALESTIHGFHASEPTISDFTITAPDDQNNNLWNVTVQELIIKSENSNAFHITPYQCLIQRCRITAPLGAGILFHDGGYQVENKIVNNYFNKCLIGISAPGGFRNATDEYIVDNYIFSDGVMESGINIFSSSGSLFRGNHFYGAASKEYLVLVGGINVSILDNYFEGMDNPRMRLEHGNPGSYSVVGNKFWLGQAFQLDYNGDDSTIIAVKFNLFNSGKSTFSGNVFEGGGVGGSIPVFNVLNGDYGDTALNQIMFDKSNMLNGSYTLAIKGASGSATHTWMIQSDHIEFNTYTSVNDESYQNLSASYVTVQNTGSATSFSTLPNSTPWLRNKQMIINNTATTTSINFSAGGGTTVTGLNPVPPGTKVSVTERTSGVYFVAKN
jgi:hypothetical protein